MHRKIIIPIVLFLSLITLAAYSYDTNKKYNDILYTWFPGGDKDSLHFQKNTSAALDELEKLISHYENNILEIQGKIKVVSSSDEERDNSEEENFEMIIDKANYQMKYSTSETISNDKEVILIDHDEKIIFISPTENSPADKPLTAGFFSLASLKNQFKSIDISTNGKYKVLEITMDNANKNARYEIIYDPVFYSIKIIKFSAGYPVQGTSEEPGEDSSNIVNSADSLVLITPDGEEFNTGNIVIHEQLLVEIHYLHERKVYQQDFKGEKYIDRRNGNSQLTAPYSEYRLIN